MSYHLGVQGIFLKTGSLMANQEATSDSDLKEEIRTVQNLAREMERRERVITTSELLLIKRKISIQKKKVKHEKKSINIYWLIRFH